MLMLVKKVRKSNVALDALFCRSTKVSFVVMRCPAVLCIGTTEKEAGGEGRGVKRGSRGGPPGARQQAVGQVDFLRVTKATAMTGTKK